MDSSALHQQILAKPARGRATRNLASRGLVLVTTSQHRSQFHRGVQLHRNIKTTTIGILQQQSLASWKLVIFVPQSACFVRRISQLQTTLKHSKPFTQNILQLLKIVNKRMTSSATLDFSHFKSHQKTLSNALGLSLQAHLADLMASRHSIFETF